MFKELVQTEEMYTRPDFVVCQHPAAVNQPGPHWNANRYCSEPTGSCWGNLKSHSAMSVG